MTHFLSIFVRPIVRETIFSLAVLGLLLIPMSKPHLQPTDSSEHLRHAFTLGSNNHTSLYTSGDYLAAQFAERHLQLDAAKHYYLSALMKDNNNLFFQHKASSYLALTGDFQKAAQLAERYSASATHADDQMMAHFIALTDSLAQQDYTKASTLLTKFKKESSLSPTSTQALPDFIIPALSEWLDLANGTKSNTIEHLHSVQFPQSTIIPLQQALMTHYLGDSQQTLNYLSVLKPVDLPHRVVDIITYLYRQHGQSEHADNFIKEFQQTAEHYVYTPPAFSLHHNPAAILHAALTELFLEAGTTAYNQQALMETLLFFHMALHISPESEDTHMMLAHILTQVGVYDEAQSLMQNIPQQSRFYIQSQLMLASIFNQQHHTDKAEAILQELLKKHPHHNSDVALVLGDVLLSDKRYQQAAESYSVALQQTVDDNWQIYYARGIAYEQNGQWSKAESDFLKALDIAPNQPEVLNYLGYSWLMLNKNLEKAEELLRIAVAQQPNDGHILDSYGWALYKLGMVNEGIVFLERATSLLPDDPTTNDHLGDAYWQSGRYHEAYFQWHKALQFNPNEKDSLAIQKKIAHGLDIPLASAQ